MKNNTVFLLSLSAILLMSSAFAPANKATPISSPELVAETPIGGAFLMYASKFGGEITKKEIADHTDLKVEGCAKGSRIFEYTLHLTKDGKTSTWSNRSGALSSEMLAQLRSLSKGDEFEFKNTKAYLPNGKDVVDVHGKKFIVV